ncbi:hypothetical protein JCM19241_5443 [Vibrio ishigakensis]|uniref:Uncharacterized protein n=1 Tax=Vibrio ishigakensis TaxID=1481914 RepID=A0A0B8QBA7_9VIBR|nr:hypothetical protein JCM19241_5443 [Vibrio ishigakensis]
MLDRYTAFLASTNLCVSDKIQAKLPFNSSVIKNFIQMPETPNCESKNTSALLVAKP